MTTKSSDWVDLSQSPGITRDYLESLSEEALGELISVAEQAEKNNRKDEKYIPNKVQERVHRSLAFIRALFSGNGVGKTTACIQEALWTSMGTHPYRETARLPNTVIIVLDDSSKADTVYLAEIRKRKWYNVTEEMKFKHGKSYTQEIRFPNGSNWLFMTHEMADTKWESIQCACVIFDEPPPRFIFAALLRGIREKDMRPWIMFAGTPLGRNAPWMYKEIYKPWKFHQDDEIECFFGSTDDNLGNLDPNTIKRWQKRYTAEELETRRHGKFEFLSGRIFDTFCHDYHVEKAFPWPRSWRVIAALDPHLRKNHVMILMGVDPDGELHVILELETSLAGRRAAEFFIRAVEPYGVKFGVCDNFGSQKLYEDANSDERKSFIELFNETAAKMNSKIRIRPTTRKEKRDDEWIEDMKDWLRLEVDNAGQARSKFHIFDTCVKVIDNYESYVWDEHRGTKSSLQEPKEEPLGTNCDYLMCVKYGLAAKPDKMGEDKVYSKPPIKKRTNRVQEYESHGQAKPWIKD